MKLIIDIDEDVLNEMKTKEFISIESLNTAIECIENGIPLDDVRAEIKQNAYPIVHGVNNHEKGMTLYGILQVLDNIGKESEEE